MHIPDGFFDAPTSLGAAAVSAAVVGVASRRTRDALDDPRVPLAGLTAAFVFAAQLVNFPVGAGTSGHLLGGALASVLVGPAAACTCLTVVLAVQALFADGGLSALGLNVLLLAVVAPLAGYAVFAALRAVAPRTRSSIAACAGLAAFASVPICAAGFAALFAIGGTAPVPFDSLLAAMVGVHVVIGVGEGLITAAAVSAVLAARPDLVHGARPTAVATPQPVAVT